MGRRSRVHDGQQTMTLPPPSVRRSDPVTSREAACAARLRQDGIARDVLDVLRAAPNGLADFEVCVALPQHVVGSVIKRRGELERRGMVEDTGRRRVNRNHRRVIVWAVTEAGRQYRWEQG